MSGSVKERGVSWETWAQRKQNEGSSSALPSEVRIQAVQLDTLIRIADTLERMLAVMLNEPESDEVDPFASLDLPVIPTDDSDTDHQTL